MTQNNLQNFLEYKTLYYDKIDYTVIQKSWKAIESFITLPFVIHIVGTNGKGSTGRYIASLLHQAKKSVLHYSSPHILHFNERIWIDGKDSTHSELEKGHQFLQKHLLPEYLEQLTYFEYTTLLAFVLSDKKEYLVLEAGLGGEFDATNVVKNNLSVFTPIGFDHQSFLGNTIEKIATTKMKSCDRSYMIAFQNYPEVKRVADKLLKNKTQIKLQNITPLCDISCLPNYLQQNFQIALNVINYLKIELFEYRLPKLKGRFEYYKKNIIIDVGHNSLAAMVIANELSKFSNKFILIYNSYEDKDYKKILKVLKPYLDHVEIIPIKDKRVVSYQALVEAIEDLHIERKDFKIKNIQEQNNYLVFGSFLVVEQFLTAMKRIEKV